MKILLRIIAVVLAFWLIWTFAHFNPYLVLPGGKFGSFLIPFVGALIGLVILYLLRRHIGWSFITAIGFAVAFSLLAVLLTLECPDYDTGYLSGPAHVYCDQQGVVPYMIKLNRGQTVQWTFHAASTTRVRIHTFQNLDPIQAPLHPRPIADTQVVGSGGQTSSARIVTDPGCFKYSFTCTPATGSPVTVDPMFWVPK